MRPLAWGVCAVLLVATGLLAGLGVRLAMRDATMPLKDAEALLAAQEALNRSLRQQIDDLRKAAGGTVCTAKDPIGALGGVQAMLGRVEGESAPVARQRLATLLDASVVLITVERDGGAKTYGTGFFVSPTMVLTTRDAVQAAKPNTIRLSNTAIGVGVPAAAKATAPAAGGKDAVEGRNYGLLVVDPAVGRKATVLGFAGQVARLNEVVVAGHVAPRPAGAVSADAKADVRGEPTYLAGSGMIGAVERAADGKPGPGRVLYAGLGHGGGSPLVDRCGRVVAMRSGAPAGDAVASGAVISPGIALSADDLVAWLGENGVKATASAARCNAGGG
jgi:hypothetical protein